MGVADEALEVIESVGQELASVPNSVHNATLAMAGLRDFFQSATATIAELEHRNMTLSHQVTGAEVQLQRDVEALEQKYEAQLATLQTEVDRLRLLLDEARAEDQWITERVAEALHVRATNMRDLTEKVLILIGEAKQMVQENL